MEEGGRARGIRVRDAETGDEFPIAAENVVNATGVWADRIRPEELHDEAEVPVIRPSRGTHITLPREDLPLDAGVTIPAGGGRVIFALPWLGSTLIGTTDNDYTGDIDHVQPSDEDIDELLGTANEFFARSLSRADITTKRPEKKKKGLRQISELGDRVEQIQKLDAVVPPLPSGIGDEIMRSFGLPPSRKIGELKKALEAAIDTGEVPSHQCSDVYLAFLRENAGRFGL